MLSRVRRAPGIHRDWVEPSPPTMRDLSGRLMVEELLNLHRGQGMDLFWRDSLTCPTEEEYVQMVLGSELHAK